MTNLPAPTSSEKYSTAHQCALTMIDEEALDLRPALEREKAELVVQRARVLRTDGTDGRRARQRWRGMPLRWRCDVVYPRVVLGIRKQARAGKEPSRRLIER